MCAEKTRPIHRHCRKRKYRPDPGSNLGLPFFIQVELHVHIVEESQLQQSPPGGRVAQ